MTDSRYRPSFRAEFQEEIKNYIKKEDIHNFGNEKELIKFAVRKFISEGTLEQKIQKLKNDLE